MARSFSGDKKQLLNLLKAAIAHRGTVMLDVISPCVTFNDHEGSTKSYKYSKDHEEPIQEIGFVPSFENIEVDYDPGTTATVRMHDGSQLRLRKLDREYDATSKVGALRLLAESHDKGEMLTGVFYVNTTTPNFIEQLNLTDQSLARLTEDQVRPSRQALDEIMEELR